MKVLILLLLAATLATCEIPPPYQIRGFRQSSAIISPVRNQPQTVYGEPPSLSNFITPGPQTQYGVPQFIETLELRRRPPPNHSVNTYYKNENWRVIPQRNYGPPPTEKYIYPKPGRLNLPQTTYNVPSKFSNGIFQGSHRIVNQYNPQFSYATPSNFPQNNKFNPVKHQQHIPETTYGVPVINQQQNPQTAYEVPSKFSQNKFINQQQYSPNTIQNTYNAPSNNQQNTFRPQLNTHHQVYYNTQSQPNAEYGAPGLRSTETLEELRINAIQSNQLLPNKQPSLFQSNAPQTLPLRQAVNFRNSGVLLKSQIDQESPQQHLPVKDASAFKKNVGWSQNTLKSLSISTLPGNNLDIPPKRDQQNNKEAIFPDLRSIGTTTTESKGGIEIEQLDIRPLYPPLRSEESPTTSNGVNNEHFTTKPALSTQNSAVKDDNYLPVTTTETYILKTPTQPARRPISTLRPTVAPPDDKKEISTEPEANEETPNIAIANAFSGSPSHQEQQQQFYLLQPDGRLQRVVFQKTQQEGDAINEYTAEYYFQNIEADPNIIYTPLITLG